MRPGQILWWDMCPVDILSLRLGLTLTWIIRIGLMIWKFLLTTRVLKRLAEGTVLWTLDTFFLSMTFSTTKKDIIGQSSGLIKQLTLTTPKSSQYLLRRQCWTNFKGTQITRSLNRKLLTYKRSLTTKALRSLWKNSLQFNLLKSQSTATREWIRGWPPRLSLTPTMVLKVCRLVLVTAKLTSTTWCSKPRRNKLVTRTNTTALLKPSTAKPHTQSWQKTKCCTGTTSSETNWRCRLKSLMKRMSRVRLISLIRGLVMSNCSNTTSLIITTEIVK